jgi:hypothetical protein
MAVRATFSMDEVKVKLERDLQILNKLILNKLHVLGEKCVNHARLIPAEIGYHDRTGALRSSTGYSIFKDGILVDNNYKGNNEQGIVVAGMEYALYVESTGRDVLTSAEQLAKMEMPKMIKQLTAQAKRI